MKIPEPDIPQYTGGDVYYYLKTLGMKLKSFTHAVWTQLDRMDKRIEAIEKQKKGGI